MATPFPGVRKSRVPGAPERLDAQAACALAEDYLLMQVGDLLGAANPRVGPDGQWILSITLGNAIRGTLGEIGTIAVDANTGEIVFPDEERTKVKQRARELARSSAP